MGVRSISKPPDRLEKNRMRKNLEEIYSLQKDLMEKINNFQKNEPVEEYQHFWCELQELHNQNIQTVARYMVRKCNR